MACRALSLLTLFLALPGMAGAATYYVRTTGDDTTGDGSTGTPWKTISKGIASANINGGDTIIVGTGTYQENTSTLGYLYVNRLFLAETIIRSESGNAADVVIQGSTATTYDTRFAASSNVTFQDVSFIPRVTTNTSAVKSASGALTNIKFVRCRFGIEANGGVALYIQAVNAALSGLTVTDCTIVQTGSNAVYGVAVYTSGTGTADGVTITGLTAALVGGSMVVNIRPAAISNVTLTNSTLSTTGTSALAAVAIEGAATVTISGLRVSSYFIPLRLGIDGASGNAVTGITLSNSVFESSASHGLLIGAGVDGATVSDVAVRGYDQGLVLKVATNVTVTRARVSHWAGGGIYAKAATNSTLQDSIVESFGGSGIKVAVEGAATVSGVTWQRNRISALGAATIYDWAAAADGGNNVVDDSIYGLCGSGSFGSLLDTTVTTLAAVRAVWTGYSVTTNDSKSLSSGGAIRHHVPLSALLRPYIDPKHSSMRTAIVPAGCKLAF